MPDRRTTITVLLATLVLTTPLSVGAAVATTAPTTAPAGSRQRVEVAVDREVSFIVDGGTTYGTLHVPAHRPGQRLPAALLLPGSGPTDRNGDQPGLPAHTLSQLAAALDADQVITLRFDKYGSGRTGLAGFAGHPQTLDYPAFVRQATAGYDLLAAAPQTDRRAMLLVGHSEGAMTAELLAAQVTPRPAGLALLAPIPMRLLDILRQQLTAQIDAAAAAGQLTVAQRDGYAAAVTAAVAAIRAGTPVDTTGLPTAIGALLSALQSPAEARAVLTEDAVDPVAAARRLPAHLRVLLTCGGDDVQVPCSSTDALTAALHSPRTTGPGRVVLPGVDHELHDAQHPTDLAPALLTALHQWDRRASGQLPRQG